MMKQYFKYNIWSVAYAELYISKSFLFKFCGKNVSDDWGLNLVKIK